MTQSQGAAAKTPKKAKAAKVPDFEVLIERGVAKLVVRSNALRRAMSEASLMHPNFVFDEDNPPPAAQQQIFVERSSETLADFFCRLSQIDPFDLDEARENEPALAKMLDAVGSRREELFAEARKVAEEKRLLPASLAPFYLPAGQKIVYSVAGETQAAEIVGSALHKRALDNLLVVDVRFVAHDGKRLCHATQRFAIPCGRSLALSALPFRFLREEDRASLVARGKRFCEFTKQPSHLAHDGHMLVPGFFGETRLWADGRCMVDLSAMQRCEPDKVNHHGEIEDADEDDDFFDEDDEGQSPRGELTAETADLALCSPFVHGYSFRHKSWGRFAVEQLRDIQFRDDAFERLSLEPDRKALIQALVAPRDEETPDLIDGKGGGCVFLLHGDPGVGKTLTAEAIAESTRRPLMLVGAGELGATPEELEPNLRRALSIAKAWNAVLLIDEADVFLEKRSSGDVVRNALVSIFLRLLEYHDGVLFLTTNRARELDPAFLSRISIGLHYRSLAEQSRRKIWAGLLAGNPRFAGLGEKDFTALATLELNGRQIKNCIRQADALAAFEKRDPERADIEKMAAMNRAFLEELEQS
jgi:hypothetical protein